MLGFTPREWLRATAAALVIVPVGYVLLVVAIVAGTPS